MSNKTPKWFLYIIRTANQSLYTGITTDVTRRLQQHQNGKGAKCLKRHKDLTIAYQIFIGDKSLALKLEYQIKQFSKPKKEALVKSNPDFDELLKLIN